MKTNTIIDIRRHNLEVLTHVVGTKKDIAQLADISQNHLYQVKSNKGLGSRACRKIEEALKLPFGWMDKEQTVDSYMEAVGKSIKRDNTLDIELLQECIADVLLISEPSDMDPKLIAKVVASLYQTRLAQGKTSDAEALMFSIKG